MSEIKKQDKRVTLYIGEDNDSRTKVGYGLNNTIIVGTSGSGKSTLMNAMIIDLIQTYSPNTLGMYLIDPKGYELDIFNEKGRIPKHISGYASKTSKEIMSMLEAIRDLALERRSEMTHSKKYIVFLDEFQYIIDTMPECWEVVQDIIILSPRSEIYVVMASQSLKSAKQIDLLEFPIRCCLRLNKSAQDLALEIMECSSPALEEQNTEIVYVRDYTKEFDIKRLHFKFRPETHIRKALKLYGK